MVFNKDQSTWNPTASGRTIPERPANRLKTSRSQAPPAELCGLGAPCRPLPACVSVLDPVSVTCPVSPVSCILFLCPLFPMSCAHFVPCAPCPLFPMTCGPYILCLCPGVPRPVFPVYVLCSLCPCSVSCVYVMCPPHPVSCAGIPCCVLPMFCQRRTS